MDFSASSVARFGEPSGVEQTFIAGIESGAQTEIQNVAVDLRVRIRIGQQNFNAIQKGSFV